MSDRIRFCLFFENVFSDNKNSKYIPENYLWFVICSRMSIVFSNHEIVFENYSRDHYKTFYSLWDRERQTPTILIWNIRIITTNWECFVFFVVNIIVFYGCCSILCSMDFYLVMFQTITESFVFPICLLTSRPAVNRTMRIRKELISVMPKSNYNMFPCSGKCWKEEIVTFV